MENINQTDLLHLLSNIRFPSSEDFSKLFLLTKKEELIRDFLIVEMENKIRSINKEFHYIAYPEWKDHDCVLLEKESDNTYVPVSLIELKYATAPFILGRKDVPLSNLSRSQDSIWLENYTMNKEKNGKVTGVKKDILKMLLTSEFIQKKGYQKPTMHQIIIIPVPKSPINKHLYNLIEPKFRIKSDSFVIQNDFMNFKTELEVFNNKPEQLVTEIKEIIKNQFNIIQKQFFSKLTIKTEFTSLAIGNAYGTEMELLFFIMSIE